MTKSSKVSRFHHDAAHKAFRESLVGQKLPHQKTYDPLWENGKHENPRAADWLNRVDRIHKREGKCE